MPPSPTGLFHVGTVRTMLFNWLFARGRGGRVVLRFEDTDVACSTEAAVEHAEAVLRWLGIDWDDGLYRQTQCYGTLGTALVVLAWSLYAAGKCRQALPQAKLANRLGTIDPQLSWHLGAIAACAGERGLARTALHKALAHTPHFHPLDAPAARRLLARLS